MKRVKILGAALACAAAFSAVAEVKFEVLDKEYDFGLVKEAMGDAYGKVRIANTGTEPIVLTDVIPSCGCTAVDYPVDPVAPGDTAVINIVYDMRNRPGRIQKSLRVILNDYDVLTVYLKGNVLGTPATLSTMYPVENGPLRLSNSRAMLGEVRHGETRNFFINAYNQSTDSLTLSASTSLPSLSIDLSEKKIGPGDIATFSIFFNSRDEQTIGPVELPMEITASDGTQTYPVPVILSAVVLQDFSGLTDEQLKNAPHIYVGQDRQDLGIVSGKEAKFEFNLLNEGATDLKISRVYTYDKALKINKHPYEIKPDKTGKLEGVVDLSELPSGVFGLTINIISNDPHNPLKSVYVIGRKS